MFLTTDKMINIRRARESTKVLLQDVRGKTQKKSTCDFVGDLEALNLVLCKYRGVNPQRVAQKPKSEVVYVRIECRNSTPPRQVSDLANEHPVLCDTHSLTPGNYRHHLPEGSLTENIEFTVRHCQLDCKTVEESGL
jgi:hypothetical protein